MSKCMDRYIAVSGYGGGETQSLRVYRAVQGGYKNMELFWESNIPSPSFLCHYEDLIFAATEEEDTSTVYMFKLNNKGYDLVHSMPISLGGICHLVYSPINGLLVGSSYQDGALFTLEVLENSFGQVIDHIVHVPGEDGKSRVHCALINMAETVVYVTNIATDHIYAYRFTDGKLIEVDRLELPKGVGPRHCIFGPEEECLYVNTEYSNEIYVVGLGETMVIEQIISTIREDYLDISYGSAIVMDSRQRVVYAANRGADTIARYRIEPTNKLCFDYEFGCFGEFPRHIATMDGGNIIAVCNQKNNELILIGQNDRTGIFDNIINRIPFYEVSYVGELN